MHELDADFLGPAEQAPATTPIEPAAGWDAIRRWRTRTRAGLIERRLRISARDREDWSAAIGRRLEAELLSRTSGLVAFSWPFRGEYDARALLTSLHHRGVRLALPVVVEKARPLRFLEWRPGMRMTRGVWNIPVPAEGEAVMPDVVIAPLVGFGAGRYRLGYGGGYYDRTIAAMPVRPRLIGVGFDLARLDTIYPQPHDVPMDVIISER